MSSLEKLSANVDIPDGDISFSDTSRSSCSKKLFQAFSAICFHKEFFSAFAAARNSPLRAGALVRNSGREALSLDDPLARDRCSVAGVDFEQLILPAPALGQVWWKGKGPLWYSVNSTQTPDNREGTKRAQTVVHT